jgi:Ni,Fe-hydrogenase I cytochrome b subunit
MMTFLKDFAEFVIIIGLIVLRVWWIFKRAQERRRPAVQSLFGKDQWWRQG